MLDGATILGRVHVRSDARDGLAVRMRSDAALRALDVQPPGIPPNAILCIRALDDPMPGAIDARFSGARRASEWESAARRAIDGAYRRAARPALGAVPPGADAVLFADRAEMLACAARDAVLGALGAWWWAHLLRGLTFAAVVGEWRREPAYVPAAFELLAATGDAAAFARAIAPAEAAALCARVLEVHRAEALAREIVLALEHAAAVAPLPGAMPPPWRTIAPEGESAAPPLAIAQRVLAGLALAVRRAPAVVMRGSFARMTAAWIRAEVLRVRTKTSAPPPIVAGRSAPAPRAAEEVRAEQPPTDFARDEHHAIAFAPAQRSEQIETGDSLTFSPTTQRTSTPERPRRSSRARRQSPIPPVRAKSRARRRTQIALPAPEAAAAPRHAERVAVPEFAIVPAVTADTLIHSQYAGVFFLINVAFDLGLLEPWWRAASVRRPFNVWHFLARVGRAFLPAITDDPLWPLLESLAGRRIYPRASKRLVARIRRRLARGLDAGDPPAFVIRRFGRIAVTAAHLDVFFPLAAHPVEVRIAGLDRDPGWIPAAGRHVSFHFE
jgi:hypothetical protein